MILWMMLSIAHHRTRRPRPRPRPRIKLVMTPTRPIESEIPAPAKMRDRRSRPRPSVPGDRSRRLLHAKEMNVGRNQPEQPVWRTADKESYRVPDALVLHIHVGKVWPSTVEIMR